VVRSQSNCDGFIATKRRHLAVELSAEERNEEIYQSLISLIENSQGRLAPIITACDDSEVCDRTILQYEADAQHLNIKTYRIVLSHEPSIRAELAKLKEAEPYLQQGGAAVFTVTGADLLSRVKSSDIDEEPTEIDKFFGYLQWTREGLQEFQYPIVIWVSYQILREMSRRAPDFWSWRKKVLRFENTSEGTIQFGGLSPSQKDKDNDEDEFLPPLAELQAQIHKLVTISPNSASLGTLYSKLGQVYARRIERGESEDLEQERQAAIKAYEMAIDRQKDLQLIETLWKMGDLYNQWQSPQANNYYQKGLKNLMIFMSKNSRDKEIASLQNDPNFVQNVTDIDLGEIKSIVFMKLSEEYKKQLAIIDKQLSNKAAEYTEVFDK
jgi:hypothetical protein